MTVLPRFQAQNPAISGYGLGWASCTAFAGAMAASFHKQVPELLTGGQLREQTGDHSGGLNLAQIDQALQTHENIDLDVRYRLPFDTFWARVAAGSGAVLQGGYGPIAASKFDAGNGFRGNHAIFVPPGFGAMDPLADGRYSNVYRYHGEAYPHDLLKAFAGKLLVGTDELGFGLVYAAFTADRVTDWYVTVRPTAGQTYRAFTRYVLGPTTGTPSRVITGAYQRRTKGFRLKCSAPFQVWNRGKQTKRSVVQIIQPGTSMTGWVLSSSWADEVRP